jgi:hypothetical protein
VKHVADKDLWTWKDPLSKPITRALGSRYLFDLLINEPEDHARNRLVADGQAKLEQDAADILHLASTATAIKARTGEDWSDARLVRLPDDFNHWDILSELGETVAKDTGMAILLQGNGKVSCRSVRDKPGSLDCNKFCQQFGGGGHFNAAGGNLPALLDGVETEFTRGPKLQLYCRVIKTPESGEETQRRIERMTLNKISDGLAEYQTTE